MLLVGFIIRIYHDARSYECQIRDTQFNDFVHVMACHNANQHTNTQKVIHYLSKDCVHVCMS